MGRNEFGMTDQQQAFVDAARLLIEEVNGLLTDEGSTIRWNVLMNSDPRRRPEHQPKTCVPQELDWMGL
jgi:hypothetical protein